MTSGIIQILINNSEVAVAVGTYHPDGGTPKVKVFPVVAAPQAKEPYICVMKKSNNPMISKDCFSRLDTSFYEVRVWSKKGFRQTEIIHELCRIALETAIPFVTDACTFNKIWMEDDNDSYSEQEDMFCHVGQYTANVVRTL